MLNENNNLKKESAWHLVYVYDKNPFFIFPWFLVPRDKLIFFSWKKLLLER